MIPQMLVTFCPEAKSPGRCASQKTYQSLRYVRPQRNQSRVFLSVCVGESQRRSLFQMDFRARDVWVPTPAPLLTSPDCGQVSYILWVPVSLFLKWEFYASQHLCFRATDTHKNGLVSMKSFSCFPADQ